jgi:hypothetical protein
MAARARGPARLFDDTELGVLWLTRGAHELAASAGGIWLRRGRYEADLTWPEVEQVQVVRAKRDDGTASLEVFTTTGTWQLGPFPVPSVQRWIRACAAAAAADGWYLLPLDSSDGFALRPGAARRNSAPEP